MKVHPGQYIGHHDRLELNGGNTIGVFNLEPIFYEIATKETKLLRCTLEEIVAEFPELVYHLDILDECCKDQAKRRWHKDAFR